MTTVTAPMSFSAASAAPVAPAPIAGWAPTSHTYTPSALHSGMIRGALDALRGVTETTAGQPLSDAQVATLAPFLANAYDLPTDTVTHDLQATHVYIGGLDGAQPDHAVTIGHAIYVGRPADVDYLTSWDGRGWLAHELGHTMQWRREPGGASDVGHTRRFLVQYGESTAVSLPLGAWRWLHGKLDGKSGGPSLPNALHDAVKMEAEANQHSAEFLAAHPD